MQQANQIQVTREGHEEKDYLYINMWLLLMVIGVIIEMVIQIVPQLFDSSTLMILSLIVLAFMGGGIICVRLALKKHAKQTRIVTVFCFFLSLVSVIIGIIAVYNNEKFAAILSLLLTIPISFFGILPTFYYGDKRENEPEIPE